MPDATDELLSSVKLHIQQGDMDSAMEALRRGMHATRSQRTTVMTQVVNKQGVPLLNLDRSPVLEPRDAWEKVDDYPTQCMAAKIVIEQGAGYPVKKSETKTLHAFMSLEEMLPKRLQESPVARALLAEATEKVSVLEQADDAIRATQTRKD